ncbi:hypothetical protein XA68_17331 [Ophiocordyceps unilateralis]|uniref:Major facilitator superfamily (MFS) profile domain-containing protein n=1 Tax=Ophiocordyceps unilateralis TaxID=268505 RepID=A0A2A9P4Q1_OPHUN|nr:hypothetical protein XA68_17331 [Ophiocordyceps unilateralis]
MARPEHFDHHLDRERPAMSLLSRRHLHRAHLRPIRRPKTYAHRHHLLRPLFSRRQLVYPILALPPLPGLSLGIWQRLALLSHHRGHLRMVLFNRVKEEVVYRIMAVISTPLLLLSCYLIRARPGHDARGSKADSRQRSVVKAVLEPRFIALSVVLMTLYAGMLVPFYYIPLYSEERGVDHIMANHLLSISYGGSFIGRIGSGWLADCFGRFNILALIGLLMSIVTLGWIWMSSVTAMVVFAVLFGLFSAGLVPLGSACVAQTTPDMGRLGLRIGVMMAISSIGALAGGPISGLLRESPGGWPAVHLFSASLSLLGALLLLAVRWWHQPRLLVKF